MLIMQGMITAHSSDILLETAQTGHNSLHFKVIKEMQNDQHFDQEQRAFFLKIFIEMQKFGILLWRYHSKCSFFRNVVFTKFLIILDKPPWVHSFVTVITSFIVIDYPLTSYSGGVKS